MSLVSALRAGRSRTLPSTTPAVTVQTRGYAAPPAKNAKKTSAKFRPNATNKAEKKGQRDAGLFRPMPVSQLSNPVFEVDNRTAVVLPEFHPEVLVPAVVNKAMAFPESQVKTINAYGLPTNILVDYMLLSNKCSVVREATIDMLDVVDGAAGSSSVESRWVFTGKSGCGKSYLLLQAVQYCQQKDWINLYIPRAINLVNASSSYVYDERTQTYGQPAFAQQLLKRFLDINGEKIDGLKVSTAYPFEGARVSNGAFLKILIEAGISHPQHAPAVLTALLIELSQQKKRPVMLAIDDFQALYCTSRYRDTYFKMVKAYHLSLPRTLLEFASGKRTFARGMVLGALSMQNKAYRAPLPLQEALGLQPDVPSGPYAYREPAYLEYAKGLRNFAVPERLTVKEAASMFDLWHKEKILHLAQTDEIFLSKYTESGGNARQFVQRALLNSIGI